MTRLTAGDVADPGSRLQRLERQLVVLTGLDLRGLALQAVGSQASADPFTGARVAAVPITTGQGVITGFSEMVAAVLRHMGCDAGVTRRGDVAGMQEAVEAGAGVLFVADDARFIALDVHRGRCVDNDAATAAGYVAALVAAAGSLSGRPVLLLGSGPVGRAAARRLQQSGAVVHLVEPNDERRAAALAGAPALRPTTLSEGLATCELILDATPAPGFVGAGDVSSTTIAAVPGIPSAFTTEAQTALGVRHIHDPLAIGVAVMAAASLVGASSV